MAGWDNFYVIVGSSAGALIGLQFVVITLIADMPMTRGTAMAGEAFTTPAIVYFSTVLLLSALVSVPWETIGEAAVAWSVLGVAGFVYVILVARRIRRQQAYQTQFEDWLFHVVLPLCAYAGLAALGAAARLGARAAMFGVAIVSLLLLFIGIHNAWDTVTWHIFVRKPQEREK